MRSLVVLLASAAVATAGEAMDPDALAHLVHQDCGSCHGLTLKGGLGPDIRAEAISHYDAETLATVVLDGIPGTAMPPWRPLISEADAWRVARYLLTGELE